MVALSHMTPLFSHLFRFAQPVENSFLFPLDISKLSVIKDRLPDYVTYGHIKLVITILELSCNTASCSTAVTPQRKGSFSSSGPPAKTPSNSRSSSQDTARKLPVWLSGKPGGKRKNPFWIENGNSKLPFLYCVQTSFPTLQWVDGNFKLLLKVTLRGWTSFPWSTRSTLQRKFLLTITGSVVELPRCPQNRSC